jgi:uncharacterized protein (TIGR03437 family)
VDVDGPALSLRAIGLDGGEIDQITLGAAPVVATSAAAVYSVVSKGDFTAAVAPGSLVAISGRNLAETNSVSVGYPLRETLSGVSMKIAGQTVPLVSVSPSQIHAQIPYGVSGPVTLQISTPNGSTTTHITVAAAAPSLLEIVTPRGLFSSSNPARPGSPLSLYMTGLGEVKGRIETGEAAPFAANPVAAPVDVWLGDVRLEPEFAGLAPGRAGVYRVDIVVPRNLADGIYALRVVSVGVSSSAANLDVVANGRGDRNDRAQFKIISSH